MKKRAGVPASEPAESETVPANSPPPTAPPIAEVPVVDTFGVRSRRCLILIAGVVATHFALYAPSLIGQKVLLPLDCLAFQNCYLPRTPEYANVKPRNHALLDQVLQFEFQRRFAADEIRAGRVPLWDPYHYCGAPFVVSFLSPFNIPYYIFPHYITWAWIHVLVALVASGGAYVFFRGVLGIGFWPAVVASWCFPLTGFFQYWFGYYLPFTVAFLPWLLVAVERTIRRPAGWGGPGLALATALLLISGAFDMAGQVLLTAGLFAVWRLGELYLGTRSLKVLAGPVIALTAGWVLGFLLAAPYWMPLAEYAATGLRIQRRAGNATERPPTGITALWQMILPLVYGNTGAGWIWLSPAPNLLESAAQAYSGLFATLVLVPLGFASRCLRSLKLFWLLMGILSAAWVLGLWPLTAILQLPGLNLMSHNRFLFVLCFAILALAAIGLDSILRGEVVWQSKVGIPLLCVSLFYLWCIVSDFIYMKSQSKTGADSGKLIQDSVLSVIAIAILTGGFLLLIQLLPRGWRSGLLIPVLLIAGLGIWSAQRAVDVKDIVPDAAFHKPAPGLAPARAQAKAKAETQMALEAQSNFQDYSIGAATLCVAAVLCWVLVLRAPPRLAAAVVSLAMLGDLLWFARDFNRQYDPSLYYPPIPALEELIKSEPHGRVVGLSCLPPLLPQRYGLLDVRGYDAVDPARIVNLLLKVKDRQAGSYDYTLIQWWFPALIGDSQTGKFTMLPVLNMLSLRYMIGRGRPPASPIFEPLLVECDDERDDYWVYENPNALPRVYVPARVEVLNEAQILSVMTDPETAMQFDPSAIAYVETDIDLPGKCHGKAEIVQENPREIHVAVDMETPGLLVLADQWYEGWNASYEGKPVPVLPVNVAIRGVLLPAGKGEVVFRYEPTGWARGLKTFALAAPLLLCWFAAAAWLRRRAKPAVPVPG
jgi:hypothetical protein